jgi:hypothetical protein
VIQRSDRNNIGPIYGNAVAVFIDVDTDVAYIKDTNGNIAALTDYLNINVTGTNTIRNGAGPPNIGIGNVGDFYIDTTSWVIYGPKSLLGWGIGTSILGPQGPAGTNGTDGSVWRNGVGVPSNALGVDGDYYLNDTNGDVYLKAGGTYSVVANILGPQGPAGTNSEGWTVIIKSANQDVTNAGVTDDNDFSFATVAGGHYMIEMILTVSGNNTTGDYTAIFGVTAGTMTGKGTCQNLTAAAAVQNIIITAAAAASTTPIITGAPTASLDDLVAVRMTYSFTASANGLLQYRFGNASAAAGRTSRTWKGSIMKYKRLD